MRLGCAHTHALAGLQIAARGLTLLAPLRRVLGVILFALIVSVPYLGWVISVITTMFGLGALWMVAFPGKAKEEVQPVPAAQPA